MVCRLHNESIIPMSTDSHSTIQERATLRNKESKMKSSLAKEIFRQELFRFTEKRPSTDILKEQAAEPCELILNENGVAKRPHEHLFIYLAEKLQTVGAKSMAISRQILKTWWMKLDELPVTVELLAYRRVEAKGRIESIYAETPSTSALSRCNDLPIRNMVIQEASDWQHNSRNRHPWNSSADWR